MKSASPVEVVPDVNNSNGLLRVSFTSEDLRSLWLCFMINLPKGSAIRSFLPQADFIILLIFNLKSNNYNFCTLFGFVLAPAAKNNQKADKEVRINNRIHDRIHNRINDRIANQTNKRIKQIINNRI